VKALYVKLPVNAPTLWKVRQWLMSDREKDMQDLTEYCRNHAAKYDLFEDEWVQWAIIEKELPQKEAAARRMTQYDQIEQQDEDFIYFVRIKEKRAPGNTAPLVFVKEKVKSIIINKRKLKFISELERNIYDDALAKNQFKIH
jgi:CRISPR/Cas system-associated endoribonuclease Cas2